ncbi:MAG: DUF3604 domain-containing protein [Halioglobus sp.]|jgi:hypothetical protein|nr:DUF3604 domain-containing protein [Halioglobus sp.]
MRRASKAYVWMLCAFSVAIGACSKVDDPSLKDTLATDYKTFLAPDEGPPYNDNRQLFFGDLHIHTGLSTDAYIMGVRSEPDDVYRFAKGEVINHAAGYPIQISRPLDFAAVTDHAEYMGQARIAELDIPTNNTPLPQLLRNGNPLSITLAWLQSSMQINRNGFSPNGEAINKAVNKSAWDLTIAAARAHNQPGVFTSFIGYEWSADAGEITAHMHRNVIYRSDDVADIPFSSLDSNRPEDLWDFLHQQNQVGKVAMAIPHNSNFSQGNMYASVDSKGNPLTAQYAAMRSRYEPISEILQIKGSSETHPLLSSEDEFANFELLGESLFTGGNAEASVKGSYLRDALRVGMEFSHSEGFNPFKYGVIGSSDSHNANSPSDENNYSGKLPLLDGSAGLRTDEALFLPEGINPVTRWSSGGLAGVWAQENTRASLFDALQRKETFATSGPRISVRFFAGWDFSDDSLKRPDLLQQAYATGVPMGGELQSGAAGQQPGFLVMASKDPEGANLDRAQIIKAWVDPQGVSHEKVYNVAAADGRSIDSATGTLAPIGNTVDSSNATYQNSIGGSSIAIFWSDPDFNPALEAFYYVRVLEIPTPRWSTFDAVVLGTKPMQPESIQERAITSAIWYVPS